VKDDAAGRYVTIALKSDNPVVRNAAIECGVRQRQASAWELVRTLASERDPVSAPFLALLASVGSSQDTQLVIGTLREPALRRFGLFALAYIGTPEAVEICLTAMGDPKLARGAGEAYCAITGAELQRDSLAAPEPPEAIDSPPPLENDPCDGVLVPPPHELWPLPDEERVRRHWQAVKSRYAPGVRHFLGKPVNLQTLLDAIESGPMLRRADLITELAIRSGGIYDVESRAFGQVQRRMMVSGRGALH
jgi:uncharacterized protein (TIGR02270 family)